MYFWKIASSRKYNSFRWKAQEITGPILKWTIINEKRWKITNQTAGVLWVYLFWYPNGAMQLSPL